MKDEAFRQAVRKEARKDVLDLIRAGIVRVEGREARGSGSGGPERRSVEGSRMTSRVIETKASGLMSKHSYISDKRQYSASGKRSVTGGGWMVMEWDDARRIYLEGPVCRTQREAKHELARIYSEGRGYKTVI